MVIALSISAILILALPAAIYAALLWQTDPGAMTVAPAGRAVEMRPMPPMAAAAPQPMIQMSVTATGPAGTAMQVQAPTGQVVSVTVPQGIAQGATFPVMIPGPIQVPVIAAVPMAPSPNVVKGEF